MTRFKSFRSAVCVALCLLVLALSAGASFGQSAVGYNWKITGVLRDAKGANRDCPVVHVPAKARVVRATGSACEFVLESTGSGGFAMPLTISEAKGINLAPGYYIACPVANFSCSKDKKEPSSGGSVVGAKYGDVQLYVAKW